LAQDPAAEYRDWAENRYNPGHWVGGNVPPSIRNLWSERERRKLGAAYTATYIIGVVVAISESSELARRGAHGGLASSAWRSGAIMLFAKGIKRRRRKPVR
jgi:hypothetical protein